MMTLFRWVPISFDDKDTGRNIDQRSEIIVSSLLPSGVVSPHVYAGKTTQSDEHIVLTKQLAPACHQVRNPSP